MRRRSGQSTPDLLLALTAHLRYHVPRTPTHGAIMDHLLIAAVAVCVSGLTMFSGFGLGTLLLPAFALFLPVESAVAATAVVHGANNVLKVSLLGRHAERRVVLRFGLPAIVAAAFGARLLGRLALSEPLATWQLGGRDMVITPVGAVIGGLMIVFASLEIAAMLKGRAVSQRWLPVGGLLSGFFGGLSGHQGALRSAFLATTKITPHQFVGTNAVIGLTVDLVRLTVYLGALSTAGAAWRPGPLVITGCLAAFAGVIVGKRLLEKVTMTGVRRLTGAMLLIVGAGLASGLI